MEMVRQESEMENVSLHLENQNEKASLENQAAEVGQDSLIEKDDQESQMENISLNLESQKEAASLESQTAEVGQDSLIEKDCLNQESQTESTSLGSETAVVSQLSQIENFRQESKMENISLNLKDQKEQAILESQIADVGRHSQMEKDNEENPMENMFPNLESQKEKANLESQITEVGQESQGEIQDSQRERDIQERQMENISLGMKSQNATISQLSQMETFSLERKTAVVSIKTAKEKRIMHYCSRQKILLVGEGDFSFSACLARAFGSAANMVATSLNSRVMLLRTYSRAATHLKELEDRGCSVIHNVDVHTMRLHPLLCEQAFDIIVYNFPHATLIYRETSISQIELHKELVKGFFSSAVRLLAHDGDVHITHKTAYPFSSWNIKELASDVGLRFLGKEDFSIVDYPGYVNKRGQGVRADESFPVGECSTFKFFKIFGPSY